MSSLVDVGKLTKPATVLIEKISSAIGVMYEPRRIKNKALAEAEASKTKALADLEIEDIQKRALTRLVSEEIKKQENIEKITEKSFDSIRDDATPEKIEDDWISNFFDKCKLISDDEMQMLWAKILAGEANNPGTFSKRTIEFMSTMDKKDAILFDSICKISWTISTLQPLVIDDRDVIFENMNLIFENLRHLHDIGLINMNTIGYISQVTTKVDKLTIGYFGRMLNLDLKNVVGKEIKTGVVSFTKIGQDILKLTYRNLDLNMKGKYIDGYMDEYYHYIVKKMYEQKIILSEPLSNKPQNLSK